MKTTNVFSIIVLFGTLLAFSEDLHPLKSPKAPLIPQVASSEVRAVFVKPEFDAKNQQFTFGNKRIIIEPNGCFSVLSDSRKIAFSYFSASTPAKSDNSNSTKKLVEKYDGSGLSVLKSESDEASKSVKISGLIGFNPPGMPEETYAWERVFSLTEDNKLKVITNFQVPEGKLHGSKCGLFFNLTNSNSNNYTSEPIDRGDKRKWHFRTSDITIHAEIPDDSFKVEVHTPMIIQENKKTDSIYLTPEHYPWVIILDPMKCGLTSAYKPGGVDFLKGDDLELPSTGKNLLPNPYMAQGTTFVKDAAIFYWFKTENKPQLITDNPKFGKYCLAAASYYSASIPADAGDYIFSIYARGKGQLSLGASSKAPWRNVAGKHYAIDVNEWKRYEFPFTLPRDGMLNISYSLRGTGALDGIQLEKGKVATEFSAPAVSARFLTNPKDCFLESGKPMSGYLELSTLQKNVRGKGKIEIKDFFSDVVRSADFSYDFNSGTHPQVQVPVEGLADGVYVVKVTYNTDKMPDEYFEHFRFSIMPWLKNEHFTRRLFSPIYASGPVIRTCKPEQFERWRSIGYGIWGHAGRVSPEVDQIMRSYGILPFDELFGVYAPSEKIKSRNYFKGIEVPDGRHFMYIQNKEAFFTDYAGPETCLLPDYRLMGGWNEDYVRKFKKIIREEILKGAPKSAYGIGSEWAAEIKDDPHYPDMVNAYFEAVHDVYPNAWVYEGGGMNLHPHDGVRQVDVFLERMKERGYQLPDFLVGHPYCGQDGINQVYDNFKALLKVAEKHNLPNCQFAFPEGMHFYAYDIPEWDCKFMSAEQWRLRNGFSYDLGWIERLGAAYYARFWLIFLTEFERTWCVTSAAISTNNLYMDMSLTPRASQKISNTLGVLFPHPKRFIGDFTFAPETRCFIWEDHEGRPIAAVWNEEKAINAGRKEAPVAQTSYRGAEYIDLMGAKRKPETDGLFPVSPFPLFIRGKAGDCDAFVTALRSSTISGADTLPFRLSEKIAADGTLELTLANDLAREIKGTFTAGKHTEKLTLPPGTTRKINVALPEKLVDNAIKKVTVPLTWQDTQGEIRRDYSFHAFLIRPFDGDWAKHGKIKIDNPAKLSKNPDNVFSAEFQTAWTKDKFLLRITVKDDVFTAGEGSFNRYDFDAVQVYIDATCSARRNNKKSYDDDDYDYTLMPTNDGKHCEIWRAVSPFMQYSLGTAAPKDNTIATEIPATFTRTDGGYVYEVQFPAPYVRPVAMTPGWNFGFGMLATDRDHLPRSETCLSLSTEPRSGCHNKPHTWPVAVFADK